VSATGTAAASSERDLAGSHFGLFNLADFGGVALQVGRKDRDDLFFHVLAGLDQMLQVQGRDASTPGVFERMAGLFAKLHQIGVRQGYGLLSAAVVFIDQNEPDIDGVGAANGDGRLEPLEKNLKLAAEGIGADVELAKIAHLQVS
jgi:hypothetical protein